MDRDRRFRNFECVDLYIGRLGGLSGAANNSPLQAIAGEVELISAEEVDRKARALLR
jgi:hypothetical protein